jgi:hypothetical protein
MPFLFARFALPLAVIVLMGTTVTARADPKYNLCDVYCKKKAEGGLTDSQSGNCFGLAFYVMTELSCGPPETLKKEPCATILKLFEFICPAPGARHKLTGPACGLKWMIACYDAGGLEYLAKMAPLSNRSKKSPGQKNDMRCAPNMTPGAGGNCVPRLDNMPGSDSTLGSTPGAGRTAPAGGGAGSAPAGRR